MRAVALDLDGTLIDRSLVPTPRTVAALTAVQEAGLTPVIATGRMFQSARRLAEQLGVDTPLVCYQGALVGDPVTREVLFHEPLPAPIAREILRELGPDARRSNVYIDDELYVWEPNDAAEHYAQVAGVPLHVVGDLARWLDQPTTKIVTVGDPVHLDGVRDRMQARFAGRAFVAKSLAEFLEFAAAGVSKATGLEQVAERLGFRPRETVAFGDGENDREMLRWAGVGVAMANGDERLRELADWVAPAIEDDGVAQVLEALLAARATGRQ